MFRNRKLHYKQQQKTTFGSSNITKSAIAPEKKIILHGSPKVLYTEVLLTRWHASVGSSFYCSYEYFSKYSY